MTSRDTAQVLSSKRSPCELRGSWAQMHLQPLQMLRMHGLRSAVRGRQSPRLMAGARSFGAMKDEYGHMDASGEGFDISEHRLESGQVLKNVHVRYKTWGQLNAAKDNVMVVCHALSGNASLDSWWGGLLGDGKAFDTSKYLVVCANVIGSCYGSTGPTSINPETGQPYLIDFPDVTIRDTVSIHMKMVREGIGANGIRCVIGGSMGGMQALEWLLLGQQFVKAGVVIAVGADHSAWQIGVGEVQRNMIAADPRWNGGRYDLADPPLTGLALARQAAMMSYRTPFGYDHKFGRERNEKGQWHVASYLEHQGVKFQARFDPMAYVKLTEQMDSHDIGRNRGGKETAMQSIPQPVLVMGIESDILYPLYQQEELVRHIPNSRLQVIHSPEGHDGFLLEQDEVARGITSFLE